MRRVTVRREELPRTVALLTRTLKRPLYRGLAGVALEEYRTHGTQTPRDGDLAAGRWVCFTTDPYYALAFSKGVLLVADQARIARDRTVVDTTRPGYDTATRRRLDAEIGAWNYDGYRLWAEIQRDDTILAEGTRRTYVTRKAITLDDLDYEVILEGDA